MIVKLKKIWNERLDMVIIDFMNLSEILNHNSYVINSLQGKRKVSHMDENVFGVL